MTLEKRKEGKVYVEFPHNMELRDWFAGMIASGVLSDDAEIVEFGRFAEWCYRLSDFMIRARGSDGDS